MKFLIVLLLALIAYVSAEQCSGYTTIAKCVGEGDVCNHDQPCTELLYCNNNGNSVQNGTCVKYAELNQDCSKTTCSPLYSCESNKCVVANNVQNNGTCQSDYQCMGSMTCVSSVCTLGTNKCKVNVECPFGTSCDVSSGNCTTDIAAGQSIPVKADQKCALGSAQNTDGKCVALYSLAANAACNDDSLCDDQLICSAGVCAAIPAATPSTTNCSATACTSYEVCICKGGDTNATSGTCYTKDLTGSAMETRKNSHMDYLNCVNTNKCVLENNLQAPAYSSCADDKCATEWCKFQSDNVFKAVYNPIPESCQRNDPICANNSSNMVSASFSLIVILSIIVASIF
ncbi:hypothetical protein DFA_03815 [Cavenderia fasciculata]|uniref:Paramecium surface antigen repeat-containing protein n=1 Tax=Cavenderia fasciculata TaxID=261658 RepID=F4Q0H0_CACFS|nr:uncharacterized protein DFA_03815 [Cavenderia fasciculata]EGG18321.1 hypothetical protein DFA_03815 [Cavenderia fasciculata]|eukprot:XP_004366225.1 hypothetical protein DFA_03815 [Cavenderia fasciculata]